MGLSTRIFWNSVIQIANKILGTLFGLLAVAIFTRYLAAEGFGRYSTVVAFASIFAIVADLGLTLVTSQMINRPGINEKKILSNLFAFRFFSGLVIIGLAPMLVWLMPYSAEVKNCVWLASLAFFLTTLNQIFVGLFQKHLRTEKIAIAEIASRLSLALGAWLVMSFDLGLAGVFWATVLANLLSLVLHWVFSRGFTKIGWGFDLKIWRDIFSRSWPLLATIVLNLIYLKADIVILSLLKDDYSVGLYGAAYKIVDVLVSLPFMFAGLLLPVLVKTWLAGEKEQYKEVWQKFFDYMILLALPLAAGGIILAEPIMHLVAGDSFAGSGKILQILMLAVVVVFISCFYAHTMISFEKQKKMIIYYCITAVTSLPLYYFAIVNYSYYGAAWVTVYSETLILLGSAYAVWREAGLSPKLMIVLKALVASLAMMAVLWLALPWATSSSHTSLLVVLGVLVYALALWLLRAIDKKDLATVFNKKGVPTVNNNY